MQQANVTGAPAATPTPPHGPTGTPTVHGHQPSTKANGHQQGVRPAPATAARNGGGEGAQGRGRAAQAQTSAQQEVRPEDMMVLVAEWMGKKGDATCKYQYDQYLAHGASGYTWRVLRTADRKPFALKVAPLGQMRPEGRIRIEMEVKCMESARHFACIRMEERRVVSGVLMLVMEYCDAGDLNFQLSLVRPRPVVTRENSERIGGERVELTEGGIEEYRLRYIFTQILLGLHYVHFHCKILHRDLKPANVLITTNGLVKIGDFGLSNAYDTVSGEVAQTICGTPLYCAPELWQNKHYGKAADMWSLGVLLYECITGLPPFTAHSIEDLRATIIHSAPRPITKRYNPDIVAITMALLRKTPGERPDCAMLIHYPYVRAALIELPQVLESSGIDRVTLTRINTDIQRQLAPPPKYVINRKLRFEGEVEKFKPPYMFVKRYLLLDGSLFIRRVKRSGAEGGSPNSNPETASLSSDLPSEGRSEQTSDVPLTKIENVTCISQDMFSIKLSDEQELFFRTPLASEWVLALSRALGWPDPSEDPAPSST